MRVVPADTHAGKRAVRESSVALCEDGETEVSEADAGPNLYDVGRFTVS